MHFSANYGTDMICQNNVGSKMIISLIKNIKLGVKVSLNLIIIIIWHINV